MAVRSAGSPQGMSVGYDDLLASITPEIAPLLMPGGGLAAEHVPWLLKAGVRQLHLGDQVRPGGSAKAYVDAGLRPLVALAGGRRGGRATGDR